MERRRRLGDRLALAGRRTAPERSGSPSIDGGRPRASRVTSSPSFDSFVEPQQGQLGGGAITTRSRGRCSGNVSRPARRRLKVCTVVDDEERSDSSSSSVASASTSSNCISSWSRSRSLRSERCPYTGRSSLSIPSFCVAINALALDAFAARPPVPPRFHEAARARRSSQPAGGHVGGKRIRSGIHVTQRITVHGFEAP